MTEQEYEDTLKRGQGPPETKEDKKLCKKCAETHTEEHSLSNQASDRATKEEVQMNGKNPHNGSSLYYPWTR